MDREEIKTLWELFLSGERLTPEEEKRLLEAMSSDLALRAELLEDERVDQTLAAFARTEKDPEEFVKSLTRRLAVESDATGFMRKIESRIKSQSGPPSQEGPHRAPADGRQKKSTRRAAQGTRAASWWAPVLVGAGLLAAWFMYLSLTPPDADSGASQRAREARLRASQEAEARRQAERDELEREGTRLDAEKKRLEAEAQLREIEEKRRALTQAKPEAVEDPQAKEKRERDLEALKRDQERIEQELREAAQLAKKTAQPAPAQPPQGEKSSSPPAPPATTSQVTTQAALAKVEEVAGDAFLVTKDGKSPVTAGANLLPGQGLETRGAASRIVLRFLDKTRVDLGPDTVLAEVTFDSGKRLAVTQGTVRAVVAKQPKGEPLIVTTPHGQAKVLGTTLRLYVDPDPKKGTKLEVEEGKVELKNLAGKTLYVESGHYAVAAVGVELVARVLPPRKRPAAYVYRGPQRPWGAILQTVSLVPNQTYILSVWIQTSTPFPGGSIGVRTESGAILAQQPFGPSDSYVRTALNFKAGSNPTAIIFAGFANSTTDDQAWIHVDDWNLVEKGGDGTNLVQDPDYEGQNPAGGPFSGPWFTEGPFGSPEMNMGVDLSSGRISGKKGYVREQK